MRPLGKIVEGCRHLQFLAQAVDQGDVDAVLRVPSAFVLGLGDISLITDEIPHLLLNGQRPVGIVDLQTHCPA